MTRSLLRVLLTVKELAAQLQIKDKTIYAWISQGKIPCVKLNGVIRFDEREIEQWLQTCHVHVDPPRPPGTHRSNGFATDVDHLIENAKREVHTSRGETRPIASPHGKERTNGAR